MNANEDPSSLIQFSHDPIQNMQEIVRQREAHQHNNEAQER